MEQAQDREIDLAAELRRFSGALLGHWRVALATAATVVGLALVYVWTATTLYSAQSEILIDPRQRRAVESEIAPTGLGTSAAGADTLLLESQVELLRSHNVLDALIRSEKLLEDPEFGGTGSGSAIARLVKTVLYGPGSDLGNPLSAYDRAVARLRDRIDVDRKRNTYVITVSVRSRDAAKAARLANRLTEIYVNEVNEAGSTVTRDMAGILASRLETLREATDASARAVERYRRDNGLVDVNETLVVEQRLGDLNRELARVQLDLQTARARRNEFQRSRRRGGAGGAGSLTQAGQSPVIAELQTQLARVDSELASLGLTYRERHPRLRRLRQSRDALLASLDREFDRIGERFEATLREAEEKSRELKKEVARLEGSMTSSNETSVELRELEREAQSARKVYESFLGRVKEADAQVDIPQSTARVISRAYPASRPSEPRALLILFAAGLLGIALGAAAALVARLSRGKREPTVNAEPVPVSVPVPLPASGPVSGPVSGPDPARPRAAAPSTAPASLPTVRAPVAPDRAQAEPGAAGYAVSDADLTIKIRQQKALQTLLARAQREPSLLEDPRFRASLHFHGHGRD